MMRHKFYQKSKTPSDGTCLGEPSGFLWCWSSFCCCYSSFVDVLHSHFLFNIIPHPSVDYRQVFRPILYFQPSPSQSDSRHFHFQPFRYLLTASATVLSGHFLPTGVFYLTLLPNIFGTSQHFWRIPDILAQPAFIKISLGAGSCRASYWSLKQRSGPSVCLTHSNPQSFIHLKFLFIHVNIAKALLVVKNLIRSAATLFSSHENIKQQPN